MKKILYSVALAACCMGTMTSCSDFLDASNKSNVTAKQSFATKEGLKTSSIMPISICKTFMQLLCSLAVSQQVQTCMPMPVTR